MNTVSLPYSISGHAPFIHLNHHQGEDYPVCIKCSKHHVYSPVVCGQRVREEFANASPLDSGVIDDILKYPQRFEEIHKALESGKFIAFLGTMYKYVVSGDVRCLFLFKEEGSYHVTPVSVELLWSNEVVIPCRA
ncbi:MAG: hypothetical protein RI935_208 [Candidatus Parcubacteria bacterium]|jgi:hypothetical protein